jgi:hypothetical protein
MAKRLIDGKEITFEAVIPVQTMSRLNPWQALKAMFGVRVCVYVQIFVNRKCTDGQRPGWKMKNTLVKRKLKN